MHTQWIEQRTVQRVSLREGLVLSLDDYNELVIARPMRLTLPAIGSHPSEEVLIDPARVSAQERPLLDLAGAVCTRAWCDDEGGALHLGFSRGHCIDVDPDSTRRRGSCTANGMATWLASRMDVCASFAMTWSMTKLTVLQIDSMIRSRVAEIAAVLPGGGRAGK